MADLLKYVQTSKTTLSGAGCSNTATSIILSSLRLPDRLTPITMADFGSLGIMTLEPGTEREENISFTGLTQNPDGTATLTGVLRGLNFVSPYTSVPAYGLPHAGGAIAIISNSAPFLDKQGGKDNDETITGDWDFSVISPQVPTMTSSDTGRAASIEYVNNIAIAGAPDASTTVKGIVEEATQTETDNRTGAGGTGARLFMSPTRQRSTKLSDYDADTGIVNAIAITPTPTITAYSIGQRFNTKVSVTNTGPTTISVSGLAATPLMKLDGVTPLVAGDIVAGQVIEVEYDASGNFQLLTPVAVAPITSLATVFSTSLTSGENLTADKPVYINPDDSKLYTAHGFKQTNTYTTFTQPTTIVADRVSKLSDTQFMTLSNSTTTLTITVFNYTSPTSSVASQTVSTSYDPDFTTVKLSGATVCRMSDSTFIVFYGHSSNSNLYFRTGSISGSVITMDTETVYTGSPDFCYGLDSVQGSSDGKVVFAYQNSTAVPSSSAIVTPTLSYLTCAPDSVTVDYTVTYSVISSPYFAMPIWSKAAFSRGIAYGLFCTENAGGNNLIRYSVIDSISGYTKAEISTNNLESPTGAGIPSVYSQYKPDVIGHNSKIYFGWAAHGSSSNTKTVLEASAVGCKMFYQFATATSAGDTSSSELIMMGNENGIIVFGFPDASDGASLDNTIYIQKDKVYGFYSDIIPGTAEGPWYSNKKDQVIVCNSTVREWSIPTLIDGFVLENITAPAVAPMYYNIVTTSGLTANARYFLKDTYTTVGDMALLGTIPVGDALSTTEIKLD